MRLGIYCVGTLPSNVPRFFAATLGPNTPRPEPSQNILLEAFIPAMKPFPDSLEAFGIRSHVDRFLLPCVCSCQVHTIPSAPTPFNRNLSWDPLRLHEFDRRFSLLDWWTGAQREASEASPLVFCPFLTREPHRGWVQHHHRVLN